MAKKKVNKSAQVRELLKKDFTADTIVKKVGCTKALVYQIHRKMREESDKKVGDKYLDTMTKHLEVTKSAMMHALQEPLYAEKTNISELLAQAEPFPVEPPYFVISDPINPDHYKRNGIEAVDVIEAFDLNYRLGNVIKYVLRHVGKNGLEDLKKARWYLDREISHYE